MNYIYNDKSAQYDEDEYLLTYDEDFLISDSIMSNGLKEYAYLRALRRATRQERALIRKYNNSTKDR